MFVVDTGLLLYAVNPDAPDHARARELVEGWRGGAQLSGRRRGPRPQWKRPGGAPGRFLEVDQSVGYGQGGLSAPGVPRFPAVP